MLFIGEIVGGLALKVHCPDRLVVYSWVCLHGGIRTKIGETNNCPLHDRNRRSPVSGILVLANVLMIYPVATKNDRFLRKRKCCGNEKCKINIFRLLEKTVDTGKIRVDRADFSEVFFLFL